MLIKLILPNQSYESAAIYNMVGETMMHLILKPIIPGTASARVNKRTGYIKWIGDGYRWDGPMAQMVVVS